MRLYLLLITLIAISACSHVKSGKIEAAKIVQYEKSVMPSCFGSQRVVLVGGCFDLLHNAHYDYLSKSRALGDYLIVALEPDETITKYKKRKPVFNQQERAKNLSAIRYVDEVLLLPPLKGYKDYLQLVQDVCPNVIAVTAGDPQIMNIKKQAKVVDAEVVEVIGLIDGISTTDLIRKIKQIK